MAAAAAESSSAICKLGRLFRLTEVHLWDDSYAAGANESQRHWRSADSGSEGSHADKTRDKTFEHIDEGQTFVEDLELVNLMGSLGLPVSFSTSKVKKKTVNKGKKKGIQAPFEEANTQINYAVRICVNTEDRESDVPSTDVLEYSNPCCSSETAFGYSELCNDDTEKMLSEGSLCVEKQKNSGCSTICSDEKATGCEAENKHEHGELLNNTGNPVKPESPIQGNQASDSVTQCPAEMLDHGESRRSSVEIYQEENLPTREDQISVEPSSVPHDKNETDHQASPSSAEPFSVDGHTLSSDINFYYDYGDWRVVWDPFYSQYYFYNIQTQESTWCPPEGLEDFALYCSTDTTKELAELGSQSKSIAMEENCLADDDRHLDGQGQDHCDKLNDLSKIPDEDQSMITTIDEAQHAEKKQNGSMTQVLEKEMSQEVASTKKKRRVRRSQSYHSYQDMEACISNDIIKYWTHRYSLFSLFDSGIKMDEEGWFSVTPEVIAKHHASRVGAGVIIDCFTGVGGNAIQFATKCKHVIAVDIDSQKIDCAQHNAFVYGVKDHIDFIVGDVIHIAPHLKGDTAFMSPPWGGPDYAKVDIYDMKSMLKPCDGYSLFKLGTMIASRIVMFLPRNINLNQLADMCLSVDPPWAVEVEKNFLNGRLKAITAYFEKQDGLGAQDHW
ncbi:hypothetical protein EJB05_06216 [Eragrostis curvula]|uniref:Trimethylguanosine synthase n=1 Tax=Eragrostis curvula TaxID=38414 RepID=A0A5J9WFD0_9POAL|nr:hypothetical protein EJB05_06216 [Eragrostis curvula]